jgi:hypothetical protein
VLRLLLLLVVVVIVVDVAHVALGHILGRLLCGGRCIGGRCRGSVRDFSFFSLLPLDKEMYVVDVLRAAGEASPGPSEALESWRAKDPYGLLSSSSHMVLLVCCSFDYVSRGRLDGVASEGSV